MFTHVRILDTTSGIMQGCFGVLTDLPTYDSEFDTLICFAGHPLNPDWRNELFGYNYGEFVILPTACWPPF